jgi:hypothetical protein
MAEGLEPPLEGDVSLQSLPEDQSLPGSEGAQADDLPLSSDNSWDSDGSAADLIAAVREYVPQLRDPRLDASQRRRLAGELLSRLTALVDRLAGGEADAGTGGTLEACSALGDRGTGASLANTSPEPAQTVPLSPELVGLALDNRRLKLEALLGSGRITPAQAKQIAAKYLDQDALRLALSNGTSAVFDDLLAVLGENPALPLGERSAAQVRPGAVLSNPYQADQERAAREEEHRWRVTR